MSNTDEQMKWPNDHHALLQISTGKVFFVLFLGLTSMSNQDYCSRAERIILIIISIQ